MSDSHHYKKNPSFRNLWTQWLEHWNLYLSQQYNVDWLLSLLLTRFHNNKLAASVDFPGGSEVKASAHNAGDLGSIPGLGRSPGEGNGNPLQYSCLLIPWTENLVGYSLWGRRVGHDWATSLSVDRLEMLSLKTSVFSVTFIKLVTFNNPDFFLSTKFDYILWKFFKIFIVFSFLYNLRLLKLKTSWINLAVEILFLNHWDSWIFWHGNKHIHRIQRT